MASSISISVGQTIGNYQITGHIANGAMGMVYRALDTRLNRDVALKVLYPHLTNDESLMRRFQREAQTIAQLNHPNIVSLYDTGVHEGFHFIAMQLIDGPSLGARIRQNGPGKPATLRDTLEVARQIATALDYAHSRGLVHRDVKPDNILCTGDGRYYLSDFSIVQLANATQLTQGFASLGTPTYMSPEQGQGSKIIDQRSDIYSLGVVLYEMLAGIPPFEANTPIGIVMKHINEPPPPIARVRPDVAPAARKLVERALAKKPADRFQRGRELAAEAERLLSGASEGNATPNLRLVIAAISALAVASAGLLGLSALQISSQSAPTATAAPATLPGATQNRPTVTVLPATATLLPSSTPLPAATPTAAFEPTTAVLVPTSTAAPLETATPLPTKTRIATATSTPQVAATRRPQLRATRVATRAPRRTSTATPAVTVTEATQVPPTAAPGGGGGGSGGGGGDGGGGGSAPQPTPTLPPPPPAPTSTPEPTTAPPPG